MEVPSNPAEETYFSCCYPGSYGHRLTSNIRSQAFSLSPCSQQDSMTLKFLHLGVKPPLLVKNHGVVSAALTETALVHIEDSGLIRQTEQHHLQKLDTNSQTRVSLVLDYSYKFCLY